LVFVGEAYERIRRDSRVQPLQDRNGAIQASLRKDRLKFFGSRPLHGCTKRLLWKVSLIGTTGIHVPTFDIPAYFMRPSGLNITALPRPFHELLPWRTATGLANSTIRVEA
jgi:hypothetical protein